MFLYGKSSPMTVVACLSSIVLKGIQHADAISLKSKLNSDFCTIRMTLWDLWQIVKISSSSILFIHVALHPEIVLIPEDDFSMES